MRNMRDLLDVVHRVINDIAMLHGEVTNMLQVQEVMRNDVAEMKDNVETIMRAVDYAFLRGGALQ